MVSVLSRLCRPDTALNHRIAHSVTDHHLMAPDRAPITPKCTVDNCGETARAVPAEYRDQ